MAVARTRGESSSTAKLHLAVHHPQSRTGRRVTGWVEAVIGGTPVSKKA